MPFSALIDQDTVHLAGPGAAEVWERAQRVKNEGRVRCRGCGGELRTRSGANTVRHFFHRTKPDACLLGCGEGRTHLRVKLALAEAIEASGGVAHVEHIATDRSFVVDVLGVWPWANGHRRIAFEVQVSQQTEEVTELRTRQRSAECDATVWVLMRHPNAEGWPVDGLGLPKWSSTWANRWPSIRLDHDLTIAGLVAHEADGAHVHWRPSDPKRLVAAIGHGKAVWLDDAWHAGWVTPSCHQRVLSAREAQRRAEAKREAERERHIANIERFVARQLGDVAALRQVFISSGVKPDDVRPQRMHAEGRPLHVRGTNYLVLPAASQIVTSRCKDFVNAHVVVADDPDDRRRLAAKGIKSVTVAEAFVRHHSSTDPGRRR